MGQGAAHPINADIHLISIQMANEVVPPILDRACFGPLFTTPTVRDTVPPAVIVRLAERHFNDDWGDLPGDDQELNMNIINGIHNKDKEAEFGRIMSVYTWPGLPEKIWIISYLQHDSKLQQDPDCCNTVVMFPSEY